MDQDHENNVNAAFRRRAEPLLDRVEKHFAADHQAGNAANELDAKFAARFKSLEDRLHTLETGSPVRARETVLEAPGVRPALHPQALAERNAEAVRAHIDVQSEVAGSHGAAGGLETPGKKSGPGGPIGAVEGDPQTIHDEQVRNHEGQADRDSK